MIIWLAYANQKANNILQHQSYYSSGKLLISGEYLVLKGATALAAPLIFGQDLRVSNSPSYKNRTIHWKSYEKNKLWFELIARIDNFSIIKSSDVLIANRLLLSLKNAQQLNTDFLNEYDNIEVKTVLNFDKEWGFGSSSTFINNIAQWANVDPYKLLDLTFKGSGYDIACARSQKPVLYKRDDDGITISNADFDPVFKENLFFVYLGKKQDTSTSIKYFMGLKNYSTSAIEEVSELSTKIAHSGNINEFNNYIDQHEMILSAILKMDSVKMQHFSNFPGSIKSLGAWGGDFILASSFESFDAVKSYFLTKGMSVIFNYSDIIK